MMTHDSTYPNEAIADHRTVDLARENHSLRAEVEAMRQAHIHACVDMAERYDADIEGCDGDELLRFGEGITCSFRLAYIIKYGKFPPEGDAWSTEFAVMLEDIRKQAALDQTKPAEKEPTP
jgi:hypothetical protein